ncbi:efflux RND transporter periplasmic adaptor subunit [Siccirubricoccus sp. G192]|uniref:efflux RND transporter periplasmic adaptor subunit n=1 Tax=Siccirubricoccus sp. G192 TaxID=2849651 RepID=UPI001C2BCA42|nr:efflux RND transporter periplasmic adaptor subunit [Siccirubricoccus sp. G192]MBV1797780.1 efflux RND transporter periplasmic adaptor subunit [Siccirubricoccus sp. G192]
MRIRTIVLGLGFAAGAAGAAFALRHHPLDVPVARQEQDIPVRVFGLGTIEAQVSSRIGFEVAGTLVEVLADHGDRVPAGTALARLNPAFQQARLAKAEAGMQSAEAQQGRVAAALERATAQLQQKRTLAQRRRELAGRGTTSVEQAELAETEAAVAAADLGVARADLAVARAALADARANLLAEQTTLAKHSLTAPFDALVIARHREPGAALAPGEAVFTLVAPGSLWALAYVDEGRAGAIREGQPAEVRLRSLPGEVFAARVVRIGLESDRVTEERRIHVRCERCPAQPIIGEQVQVEVETGRLPAGRLVPEAAVEGFDGASGRVWLVEDGRLRQQEVRFIARTLDARLALDPALPEGLAVVTRVPSGAREGRTARAAP